MLNRALLAAVSLVTLSACEADANKPAPTTPTTPASQQTWLCGREYVNHAWGYQRRGVVLDTAGNIWKYDFKGSPAALVNPWSPKDVSRMSEEELKLRYNGAMVVTGKKVPLAEIQKNMPLIGDAAEATPPQPTQRGADMGQTLTYCYTYDANTRTYSQVMLDNKGDWDSTNPSQAATNLRSWLNGWFKDVN